MRRCLAIRRDVRTSRPLAAGDLLRLAGACFLALAAGLATVVHGASPPTTLRFGANGTPVEGALMAWDGMPGPEALRQLPRAR